MQRSDGEDGSQFATAQPQTQQARQRQSQAQAAIKCFNFKTSKHATTMKLQNNNNVLFKQAKQHIDTQNTHSSDYIKGPRKNAGQSRGCTRT